MKLDMNKRYLVLGDTHFPFYDRTDLLAAVKYAKRRKIKDLILNGDSFDFLATSKFPRQNRTPMKTEVRRAMKQFNEFISHFDNVIYVIGNHEERPMRYLLSSASEFTEVYGSHTKCVRFILEECGLSHNNIKFVECKTKQGKFKPLKFGKLNIFHGHELRVKGYKNPAEKIYNIISDHALTNHFHVTDDIIRRKADGSIFRIVCLGTAQKYAEYVSHQNWSFSFAEVRRKGTRGTNFVVTVVRVVHGEEY